MSVEGDLFVYVPFLIEPLSDVYYIKKIIIFESAWLIGSRGLIKFRSFDFRFSLSEELPERVFHSSKNINILFWMLFYISVTFVGGIFVFSLRRVAFLARA